MKYIDSSAFVKYYSEESSEKGSDKVKEIIDRAKEGKETLSDMNLINAAKKEGFKIMNPEQ